MKSVSERKKHQWQTCLMKKVSFRRKISLKFFEIREQTLLIKFNPIWENSIDRKKNTDGK